MEEIKFNMNDYVKVKLTNCGVSILMDQHEKLKNIFPRLGEFKINLEADGYYKTQLHDLFNTFGQYIYMGATELPFETNIILVNNFKDIVYF